MVEAEDSGKQEHLKGIINNLPESPGCYQFLDKEATIIYVGKAINLKRRVASYFRKDVKSLKTTVLASKICDIKYVVVKTEQDALLLENSLIKQHKPRYNILLKDDKTYPSICITNEYFPRIFKTRRINKKLGTFFGPYSHVGTMNAILALIKQLYPIRTCRLDLTDEKIEAGRFKVCLEYHIKNCKGPCIGDVSRGTYMEWIEEAKQILKGKTQEIKQELTAKMKSLSSELRFEEAQEIKNKIMLIDNFRTKSEVVSNAIDNVDVFSIEESNDNKAAYINFLHITNGWVNQAFTFEYRKKLDETQQELLQHGIIEMRKRFNSTAKEIIIPFEMDFSLDNITLTVPQKGEKRKLLELSIMNVKQYKIDRLKQSDKLNPGQRQIRVLKELQDLLKMEKIPMHIEAFDNSNIQGTNAVAACIVFKAGKPEKKEYRKFAIKTVAGQDDYASMREVAYRRYSRMIEEGTPLPDLIIADGGKGQMEAIRQIIQDCLNIDIPIAGLAKDNKHRTSELLYGFPQATIGVKHNSEVFRLLTKIQDEAHRFAITFHKNKRSKAMTASELDNIKGIGPKTKETLIKKYKSVKRIQTADYNELSTLIGENKAKLIAEHFANNNRT